MFWDKLRRDKFKHGSSGYFCLNNFQVLTARVFGWASRLLFTRFISSEVYSNTIFSNHTTIWLYIYIYIYTGCPRRNVPDFGRAFLMLKYTEITQKHLYPKLNGYGDNGQRKVWSSGGSTLCTCQLTALSMLCRWVWCHMTAIQLTPALNCLCTSFRVMT